MSHLHEISDDEFDTLLASVPSTYSKLHAGTREVEPADIIEEVGPISIDLLKAIVEYVEGGEPLNGPSNTLAALRHTHHRLAQLLANGMDETQAARLCNYTQPRVSILKNDPAFRDLLTHYAGIVDEEFHDFVSAASGLGMDALQELQARLDETPATFSNAALMEVVKLTADRTGNGPMAKNLNLNVNANLGDKLKAARERANAAARSALAS